MMTSENGLRTWVYKGKNQLISILAMNHSLFPPISTDTWVNLVSSNSACCSQRDFRHLGSMSQNGSSDCLTNGAICLELNVYNKNHQPSCFFSHCDSLEAEPQGKGLSFPAQKTGSSDFLACLAFTEAWKVLPNIQCPRSWWIKTCQH